MAFGSAEKNFRLKSVGESAGGYEYFERTDQSKVEEFLEHSLKVVASIAERAAVETGNGIARGIESVWHAIKARELTSDQSYALRKTLEGVLATSAYIMAPSISDVPTSASNEQTVSEATQENDSTATAEETIEEIQSNLQRLEQLENDREASPVFYAEVDRLAERVSEQRIRIGLFNASKPVIGAEDFSREDYLRTQIVFENPDTGRELPQAIQDELRDYVVAQVFRESMFDNSSVNPRTRAFGTVQAMPATAVDEGYSIRELHMSFTQQVEFMGGYYARMYGWLNHHIDDEAMEYFKQGMTEEEFQRTFMVPLLINSYNAGVGTMSRAMNEYYRAHQNEELTEGGGDRFIAVRNFAEESSIGSLDNYREEAGAYVTTTLAEAEAIRRYREQNQNVRVAYND